MFKNLSIFIANHLWVFGIVPFVIIACNSIYRRFKRGRDARKKYEEMVANDLHIPLSMHPHIDVAKCGGCGTCVASCPEGEIIKLIDHKATLIEPGKCVGHGVCSVRCPFGAITLVFGTKAKGMRMPQLDADFQTNVPGLYVAGELGGMGLISNAVKQGRLAAEHALRHLHDDMSAKYDVVIVGAGPAGLAAAMAATAAGRKYVCIEQNRFGGSICNFPKQKIVTTRPLDFSLAGEIKFARHRIGKDELLGLWSGMRGTYGLRIKENVKFLGIKWREHFFEVLTDKGSMTTQKVILCLGVRGSPRKLEVEGEELDKVTYSLEDAEQYQHKALAIVGGGNAAVEAACELCRRRYHNKVVLLVRSGALTRCNTQNQAMLAKHIHAGRIQVSFETNVKKVYKDRIVINRAGEELSLANDFLFIMAGAVLPYEFLESLGISIVVKYGEPVPGNKKN